MKYDYPNDLSDNACLVLEKVCDNLYLSYNNVFEDFSKISLPTSDIDKACKELQDNKLVIYCHDKNNKPYLIAQGKAIEIVESYRYKHSSKS